MCASRDVRTETWLLYNPSKDPRDWCDVWSTARCCDAPLRQFEELMCGTTKNWNCSNYKTNLIRQLTRGIFPIMMLRFFEGRRKQGCLKFSSQKQIFMCQVPGLGSSPSMRLVLAFEPNIQEIGVTYMIYCISLWELGISNASCLLVG